MPDYRPTFADVRTLQAADDRAERRADATTSWLKIIARRLNDMG